MSKADTRTTIDLDPKDPIHKVLLKVYETIGSKQADYSSKADPFANFNFTGAYFNMPPYRSCDFLELLKLSRLKEIHDRGTKPVNEDIIDTYLDKAVYAILAFASYLDECGRGD